MADDIYTKYNIDINKLKRDYIKNPLIWIPKPTGGYSRERPNKEDLKYLYIDCNITIKEMIKYFNVSHGLLSNWLKYYNIKKDKKLECINREKSVLKKYGVTNAHQSNLIKEKIKQTCLEKYGVENPAQLKEIIGKAYNTKKKNHTFGKSKEEDEIYNLLCSKYKEVKRQYKENRYPFACDFYVPELDLFIEYQGYFTHGKEPYTGTKKQKETIKLWESKNTTKYNDAINTWVKRDPLKRETAKKNHLKYLEFFNKKDFMNWYNVINNNI